MALPLIIWTAANRGEVDSFSFEQVLLILEMVVRNCLQRACCWTVEGEEED